MSALLWEWMVPAAVLMVPRTIKPVSTISGTYFEIVVELGRSFIDGAVVDARDEIGGCGGVLAGFVSTPRYVRASLIGFQLPILSDNQHPHDDK